MLIEIFKTVRGALRSRFRPRALLLAENLVLRQQVAVSRRSLPKSRIRARDRALFATLGEAHLQRAILEYKEHFHEERNHQGLDNELIVPAKAANGVGKVERWERLGGILSFYYRKAA